MNSKIFAYVGFAINKGSIIFGLDALTIYRKKVHLILMCSTTEKNTKKKTMELASKKNWTLVISNNLLEEVVLKKNVKVCAITDMNLANAILQNLDSDFTKCVEVIN